MTVFFECLIAFFNPLFNNNNNSNTLNLVLLDSIEICESHVDHEVDRHEFIQLAVKIE